MSPNIIQAYLDKVEQLLLNSSNIYVEEFSAVILTEDRANIRVRIRFSLRYLLAISEILVVVNNQITYIECVFS